MLARIVFGSLRHNRAKATLAILSTGLAAAVFSAVLLLNLDVRSKMEVELRAAGPNLFVSALPSSGSEILGATLPAEAAAAIGAALRAEPRVESWAAGVYGVARVEERPVVIAGFDLEALSRLAPYLGVPPAIPAARGEAEPIVVGVDVARALSLGPGSEIVVRGDGGARARFLVAAIVDSGGPEDRQLIAAPAPARALLGRRPGEASVVLARVSGGRGEVEEVARRIAAATPGVDARPIARISRAEGSLLDRLGLLLSTCAAAVILLAALSLAMAITASVVERAEELALFRALGAGDRTIVRTLGLELALVALAGAAIGLAAGSGFAGVLSRSLFGARLDFRFVAVPATLALALVLALLGALFGVRKALALDPARVLHGGAVR